MFVISFSSCDSCAGAPLASAATFGTVVPIGGTAADIALDEGRGVLYIADYTSGRIDVMSTASLSITRSITVPNYPGGVAHDARRALPGNYPLRSFRRRQPGATRTERGHVLDLMPTPDAELRTPHGPGGSGHRNDGLALILTQDEFLLLDPASGVTTSLGTVANVQSQTLPVSQANFPTQILAGALTATGTGSILSGLAARPRIPAPVPTFCASVTTWLAGRSPPPPCYLGSQPWSPGSFGGQRWLFLYGRMGPVRLRRGVPG